MCKGESRSISLHWIHSGSNTIPKLLENSFTHKRKVSGLLQKHFLEKQKTHCDNGVKYEEGRDKSGLCWEKQLVALLPSDLVYHTSESPCGVLAWAALQPGWTNTDWAERTTRKQEDGLETEQFNRGDAWTAAGLSSNTYWRCFIDCFEKSLCIFKEVPAQGSRVLLLFVLVWVIEWP